jgi:energy-coupling factor transport system substrate-specific component
VKERILSLAVYGLSTTIGVAAFLYPFFMPAVEKNAMMGQSHAHDAPLLLTALVGVCFAALLLEVQAQAAGAKMVALIGILVSMNSILRFAEVAIPGPGGFSPIFFLIVLTGYVYGGVFGFLIGSLTLLVSGLITGTSGPWLPYQMFTAGWVGMSAPLCRPLVALLRGKGKWTEVVVLALFAGLWGLVYGAIMNIWFWPFAMGSAEQHWQSGMGWVDTLKRYMVFYLATSLVWDVMRLAGNVALTLAFGLPTLRALRRFQSRFTFTYSEHSAAHPTGGAA